MQILLEIFAVAILAIFAAKLVAPSARGRTLSLLKAWVTVRAFWLLLAHPVTLENGSQVVAGRLVLDTLAHIDSGTFWTFLALAAGIKFVGLLASMYRWILLLRGQAIELPFRHIFGSFLIGRFIGTFLPGTTGLDGYKLYDAARFSGKSVEVTATTVLEKAIGFSGIFLSFLIVLPFGIVIFGADATAVAWIAVPICVGLNLGLMLLLFYPSFLQWAIEALPIPGKARLTGLVMRFSHAVAAYRDKRALVANAFALSCVMQFSTAAMYFFTAPAIGAAGAEFWPIAFGSSIQTLVTVLSPLAIAGEGIREAAQHTLLGNMIGPANAAVSTALGFLAAEALTLAGGFFWWFRRADYTPAYCLVDSQQVDYEATAKAATAFIDMDEEAGLDKALPTLAARVRFSAGLGLGTGILSGLAIGIVEALVISQGGFGAEAQVLWYGPLNYGAFLGLIGLGVGTVLGVLPMDKEETRGWTPALATLLTLVPIVLAVTLFRIHHVYVGQAPPLGLLATVLTAAAALAIALFFYGPGFFRTRLADAVRPGAALSTLLVATGVGIVASVAVLDAPSKTSNPPGIPAALADRPNVILLTVDSLRMDELSCYDGPVHAPAICSLMESGGTIYGGDPQAAETPASILTSLGLSAHVAVHQTAALRADLAKVSEVMKERGYVTGIISDITRVKGFDPGQSYDESHYLAPDTLIGAEESSSHLSLYDMFRAASFEVNRNYRFGDFYQDSEVVNQVAFDFLSQYRASRFFLDLHYMDPHAPYFAHPYNGYAIGLANDAHADGDHAAESKRLYQGEIEYFDANFQKLLDKLRDYRIYDNTVIVLVADQGESRGEAAQITAVKEETRRAPGYLE